MRYVGAAVVILCYICLLIIAFAPSIYAGWFYVIGRKLPGRKKRLLRSAVSVFCINAVLVYFLFHLAFDLLVGRSIIENNALAEKTARLAIECQEKYYAAHGRYYPVGPVRGPYSDEHGLRVEKGVVLFVEPKWDQSQNGAEFFEVYAFHIWGRGFIYNTRDGKILQEPDGTEKAATTRKKLMRDSRRE